MNLLVKPFHKHTKLLMLLCFTFAIIVTGVILRAQIKQSFLVSKEIQESQYNFEYESMTNASATEASRAERKEYLYRILTNTTRSLIQMEIKARRLEENMRRIKEKTADLLWKNKDRSLWHILFKNISKHISIRHEFHHHASLRRIMHDNNSYTRKNKAKRKLIFR